MNISIKPSEKNQNVVCLVAPYHPSLPASARDIGGKWSGSYWWFDKRDEQRVRDLAIRIYGTDGSQNSDTVTVRVDASGFSGEREIFSLGRQIVSRISRDNRVRLGDGVILESGSFASSGGSRNNPCIGSNNAILIVRDVPRALANEKIQEYPERYAITED